MGTAFERRIVVVTGASTRVGRAIVHAFAARGAHVGLIARGAGGLEAPKAEVEEMGGRALALPIDMADAAAVDAAAERVERELGPIDVWVNDGTAAVFGPALETTPAEFKRVIEVAYLGYVHGTLAALKRMRARDRGRVIQIGSALAYRSPPMQSAQAAANHAVRGFTESLRTELRHQRSNLRVTEVEVPIVDVPEFSWKRTRHRAHRVLPALVADAVLFATEHDRREVMVGVTPRRTEARIEPSGAGQRRELIVRDPGRRASRRNPTTATTLVVGAAVVTTFALAWSALRRSSRLGW